MNNLNLIRGLVLMAIAAVFGIAATQYPIGQFSRSGPGLFPLFISSMLFVIGLVSVIRSYYVPREPVHATPKNISIILLSLIGFTVISQYINMLLGIAFLVFFASIAASSYSVIRNVKITAALIAIAFMFKNLLGLALPLI